MLLSHNTFTVLQSVEQTECEPENHTLLIDAVLCHEVLLVLFILYMCVFSVCVFVFRLLPKAQFPSLDLEQCASVRKRDRAALETALHTHTLIPYQFQPSQKVALLHPNMII